ncbi:hypothetical protein B0H12DRAFT_1236324 [Mycena haematopus]|nr:hypothetical protein B0H12DRAFT_1236324 [Mycena haematopus]
MKTPNCSLFALVAGCSQVVLADSCADPSQAVPVYRDFNDAIEDHFYTTNVTEYNVANTNGYFAEDQRFAVFPTAVASTVHLIRLFNGGISDHFYTTNASEASNAASAAGGYDIENLTPMYIYSSQICGSVPLYRSYSPTNTDHFYTTSETERDTMTGYNFELIAGYVLPLVSASSLSIGDPSSTGSVSASPPANTNAALPSSLGPWSYIYSLHLLALAVAVL